jgi:hypothetical protein
MLLGKREPSAGKGINILNMLHTVANAEGGHALNEASSVALSYIVE